VTALLSLLLVLVLPAVAAMVALADDPSGPDRDQPVAWDLVVARGLACGLSTWLLGSGLLARTVGLTDVSTWAFDAAAAAVAAVVLALPRQRRRLRLMVRPLGRRMAEVAGLTALVFAPLGYVIVRTSWSPLGSTPWYYYGLARQVAEVGSIPATSVEFATGTPFLNDYHLFTTGTAMLLLQHPHDPITVLTIINLLSVLALGFGTAAVATALGAARASALLAVPFAIATGIGAIRSAGYRPEGFALGLVLVIVALGIDWFRNRDRRSLAAAGALVASLSQVHGIAAVTAGVLVTAAAVAFLAVGPRAESVRRAAIALTVFLAIVILTALVFREASGTVHAGGLVDQGGLADPTWEFYAAARGQGPSVPPSNGSMLWGALGFLYSRSWWWMTPAAALAGLGLVRRRHHPDVRTLGRYSLLALLGLALVSSVFMLGWQGYVPRRTGASRLPLDASLLVPPLLAIGLGALTEEPWLWRGRSVIRTERRRPLLIAVLSVCGIISMLGIAGYDSRQALSQSDLAVWRSLPLHHDDVVLANGYTEGFIPDVTPAVGLLDGRAPYTFGTLLHRADRLFRGAQGFFTDPAGHWSYLADHHVSWVVVGTPGTYALSTSNTWDVPSDLTGLEACHGLDRVVGNDRLTVFRVVDPSPAGCSPGG
jgi:hypothetical protein